MKGGFSFQSSGLCRRPPLTGLSLPSLLSYIEILAFPASLYYSFYVECYSSYPSLHFSGPSYSASLRHSSRVTFSMKLYLKLTLSLSPINWSLLPIWQQLIYFYFNICKALLQCLSMDWNVLFFLHKVSTNTEGLHLGLLHFSFSFSFSYRSVILWMTQIF